MYAVIKMGGKQYRVEEGQTLRVEKLDLSTGANVDLGQALLVSTDNEVKVGAPFVEGSQVSAEVVEHGRHKKVNIIKFKRRKHHMKTMGHRQWFTEIKITEIK